MRAADQTEYIVQAIREGASMYEDDARAFLAEHDAHVRAEAMQEFARTLTERIRAGGPRARGLVYARRLAHTLANGDTPTPPRRNTDHQTTAAKLRTQPGEWLPVGDYSNSQSANVIARSIRGAPSSITAYQPRGAYEARTEQVDDGVRVHARYIGPQGGAA